MMANDATTPLRPGIVPCAEDVAIAFAHHFNYYAALGGDAGLVLLNAERSVQLQYVGRVAFELLQNALDRARSHVRVAFQAEGLDAPHLVVANDGDSVTLDPTFDYRQPPPEQAGC